MIYHLRNCVWEITLACCFSCKYCGSKGGKARENELTLEECLRVAGELGELGCERVSMIGGEVFMRKDWDQIAGALTGQGIRTAIITNGFLFTEELIQKLKNVHIESVAVSLDGPQRIHDAYRQEGSFARAEQAIRILSENEIPVSVISTLNAENTRYLEEFYIFLQQYPIRVWQMQACSPMGNAAISGIDYYFSYKKLIEFIKEHVYDAPFLMGVADNIGYFTEEEGMLRGNIWGNGIFPGCSAGISAIGIDSVGNVRGCESMYDERFNEGNLRDKSLKDIWENPEGFAYNRQMTLGDLEGSAIIANMGFSAEAAADPTIILCMVSFMNPPTV